MLKNQFTAETQRTQRDTNEMMAPDEITERIIGAAIEVHRNLGPGLLESSYHVCLCRELNLRNVPFLREVELPIVYKEQRLDAGYRLDLLVADLVIVELKSVEKLEKIHDAQLLTYLKLARKPIGLLINFNVPVLKDGVRRKVLDYKS